MRLQLLRRIIVRLKRTLGGQFRHRSDTPEMQKVARLRRLDEGLRKDLRVLRKIEVAKQAPGSDPRKH